ncbi:MAG: hypothetical protein ACI837_001246, partial [Crocinitomicaceae bacterium]
MKTLLLVTVQLLLFVGASFGQLLPENSTEIVSKRDANSKTYQKADGTLETIISAGQIHYQSNGEWVPFNTEIVSSNSGTFAFESRENTLQSFFPAQASTGSSIALRFDEYEISIGTSKKFVTAMNNDAYPTEIGHLSGNIPALIKDNSVTYNSKYQGMSDEYLVENGMLKNNFIIDKAPSFMAGLTQDYFGLQEELTLPDGWIIVPMEPTMESIISTSLKILDDKGEHILTIPAPFIYEKENTSNDGSAPIIGKYML